MEKLSQAALEPQALDVPTFCLLHSISRAMLYQLWRHGHGPEVMKIGTRTLISKESAEAWRNRMQDATQQPGKAFRERTAAGVTPTIESLQAGV